MSKSRFLTVVRDHAEKHSGLLGLCARVTSYSLALLGIMWVAETFFDDSYAANISFFTLFSVVFELLWSHRTSGARLWWYVVCVVGLSLSGVVMVREALQVRDSVVQVRVLDGRLQAIMEKSPGAVFATDEFGVIRGCSPGVLKLTGFTREELVGRSITTIFPEQVAQERIAQRRSAAKKMYEEGDPGWSLAVSEKTPLLKKSGETIHVTMYVFGIRFSVERRVEGDIQFVSLIAKEN